MKFYKYTPALLAPKTLEDTLIGRDLELDNLKRILKSAATGKSFSHPILIGPKGIGKSHMLRIIYHAVRGEIKTKGLNAFKDKYMPVIFSEEEYPGSITKFIKLILHYLEAEAGRIPLISGEISKTGLSSIREKELAFEYIKTFKKKTGKILLLLVDNLNDIIDRFTDEDQSSLRELLMAHDSLLLIGAAPTLFDSIINHDRPFYNFFEIIWLKDLSFEDTVALLTRYAELEGKKELIKEINDKEPKLRAIHELAGGNPRLILSLYHIVIEGDISSVEDTFLKLLDELSPYFRERMKDLSEQQKEIIDVMARAESLLTPTEIAGRCQVSVNIVNSQLKRLEKIGCVRVSRKHAKKVFYDFNERLFSLWRQMRVDAGRKRLGFIVRFLEIWFTKDELHKQFENIRKEIWKHMLAGDVDKAGDYLDKLWYIKECLPAKTGEASAIVDLLQEFKKSRDGLIEVFKDYSDKEKEKLAYYCWRLVVASAFAIKKWNDPAKMILKKAISSIPDTKNKTIYLELYLLMIKASHMSNIVKKDDVFLLLQFFLNEAKESGNKDLVELLTPFSILLKYLETKDSEIIDRLRHEERVVVEDMLKLLGEKVAEKPKKIKQKKKMLVH